MSVFPFLRHNAPWLGAGALLTFLSSFGQTFFISVFAGQIRTEFDLSHGDWGLIYMTGTLASAAVMVWAGVMTDRFRVRHLGAVILVALALSCLAMAANRSVWLLFLVVFALRFTGQGMTSHIAVVAMARWFSASRGKAQSIARLGFSVGEAGLPILIVTLMALVDWRFLWVASALVCVMSVPVLAAMLRHERLPGEFADDTDAAGLNGRHWRRGEVLRHPLFWLIVPLLLGPSAFGTALFFHQVHLAEVKGWSHAGLVALFPLYTGIVVLFSLISGWAVDRFGVGLILPVTPVFFAIGFLTIGFVNTLGGAAVGLAFVAMGYGGMSTAPSTFWAVFFGTRHLGAIKSLAAAMMVLGSAIGPGLTGALIDLGVMLPDQMGGIFAFFLLSAALIGFGMARYGRRSA